MKTNKFLPQSYTSIAPAAKIVTVIFCLAIVISLYRKLYYFAALFAGLLILTIILYKRTIREGLYVFSGCLFYQSFIKKHQIQPSFISAIKITPSLTIDAYPLRIYGLLKPLKKGGAIQYTMFLLQAKDERIRKYVGGDLVFLNSFRKEIICRCIYDKETIDYLLTLNPDIVVWQ